MTAEPENNPHLMHLLLFHLNKGNIDLMYHLKQRSISQVENYVKALFVPSTALVDAFGRPFPVTASDLQGKLASYLHDLIDLPTLDEEWIAAGGPDGVGPTNTTGASFKVVHFAFLEFTWILEKHAPDLAKLSMVLLSGGLNAICNGLDPIDTWIKNFEFPEDMAYRVLLGAEELKTARKALFAYATAKGLVDVPAMHGGVLKANPSMVRLLKHLIAIISVEECIRRQGPNLSPSQLETKTENQIRLDLEA